MDINSIYTDFWEILAQYLSSDDIFAYSLTCKQAYRACKRRSIQEKIAYPLLLPNKLTYDQRELVRDMENKGKRFKLIHGDVGSGKTITSISYAVRNYTADPEAKVVMCGPPSLVKMWWSTLQKYFGIEPAVLHQTNTKYKAGDWKTPPDQKFILVSYKGFYKNQAETVNWFDPTRDLLIIDEAHHRASVPFTSFYEVIGLSATTNNKKGLANGVRYIAQQFNVNADDCVHTLKKTIIARELPKVVYHSYMLGVSDAVRNNAQRMMEFTRAGAPDMKSVPDVCRCLSHPEIIELRTKCTAGMIMVGRKTFKVPPGSSESYYDQYQKMRKEIPGGMNEREIKKNMMKYATFDYVSLATNHPKAIQALHIIKNANDKGEKVLLFDMSTTYLPFLHQLFTHYGINSYVFSTHFDVSGRQRQLTRFKEDKKPGVLLSSISMLGEGQNVTEANHVIFFSQCLQHTKYYQAVGRCWRYPQTKQVHVHLLFAGMFDRMVYNHACGSADLKDMDWLELLGR